MPNAVFSANTLSACKPFCVTFTDASNVGGSSISSWNWNFGDGGISDVQNPQHCFSAEGNYSITLTVGSNNGCSASYTNIDLITLAPLPEANFSAPLSSSTIESNVSFTDNSIGASSWNWNFSDGGDSLNNTSSLQDPAHAYSKAGTYCVTLTVTNNAGCADTIQKCIIIKPEFTLYIPNSFSPNGDGNNDEFYCKGDNISKFEMSIYDRWGGLVFSAKDINEHWSGKSNKVSAISQQDVYIYDILITDSNYETYQYKGNVSLVR